MLPDGLVMLGAVVDVVPIYRSVMDAAGSAELRARLDAGDVDLVTFTSASGVEAFVVAVGEAAARRAPAASIGPITSEAARRAGLDVIVEAEQSTMAGLVSAIARKLRAPE